MRDIDTDGICPVGNYCEITASPDGAICGSEPVHLTPLLPAEGVCLRALRNRAETMMQRQAKASESRVHEYYGVAMEMAWYGLELGLNGDNLRQGQHFADAMRVANNVETATKVDFALKSDAALLRLYMPAFELRSRGLELSPTEISSLQAGVGEIYSWSQQAPIHRFKVDGPHLHDPNHVACLSDEHVRLFHQSKLAILMLALRQGTVLFPASDRELCIPGRDVKKYHHEFYIFEDGYKYPIKVTTDDTSKIKQFAESDDLLLRVSFSELVCKSFNDLGHPIKMKQVKRVAQNIINELQAEAMGAKISTGSKKILDAISQQLATTLDHFKAEYKTRNVMDMVGPNEPDTKETHWTILPVGNSERDSEIIRNRLGGESTQRRVDYNRITKLTQVVRDWGDGYLVVANLKRSGKFEYVAAVLREVINGQPVEHAIAENPGVGNAMFVFRAELGMVNGKVVMDWKDVFSGSRPQARALGAYRIVHTVSADINLLDYLTSPHVNNGE